MDLTVDSETRNPDAATSAWTNGPLKGLMDVVEMYPYFSYVFDIFSKNELDSNIEEGKCSPLESDK